MSIKKSAARSPMKYKTGTPRLGPLNMTQLLKLLDESKKPKVRAKIQRRIEVLQARGN